MVSVQTLKNQVYWEFELKMNSYLCQFVQLYFYQLIKQLDNCNYLIDLYSKFINDFNNCDKFNLDYETLFLEFKSKVLDG